MCAHCDLLVSSIFPNMCFLMLCFYVPLQTSFRAERFFSFLPKNISVNALMFLKFVVVCEGFGLKLSVDFFQETFVRQHLFYFSHHRQLFYSSFYFSVFSNAPVLCAFPDYGSLCIFLGAEHKEILMWWTPFLFSQMF